MLKSLVRSLAVLSLSAVLYAQSHEPPITFTINANPANAGIGVDWGTTVSESDTDTTIDNQPIVTSDYITVNYDVINSGTHVSWNLIATGSTYSWYHVKHSKTEGGTYYDKYKYRDTITNPLGYIDSGGNEVLVTQVVNIMTGGGG